MASGFKKLFLRTLGKIIPSDVFAYRIPVSVKGICFIDNKVILLKNELGNWDLPGGKLNRKEQAEDCLKREFFEEVGIEIKVEKLLGVHNLRIQNKIDVLVLIYQCSTFAQFEDMRISEESFDLQTFECSALPKQFLPTHFLPHIEQVASNHAIRTTK